MTVLVGYLIMLLHKVHLGKLNVALCTRVLLTVFRESLGIVSHVLLNIAEHLGAVVQEHLVVLVETLHQTGEQGLELGLDNAFH